MTAWDLLIAYSTAPAGSDAWTHLNAQEGGGDGTVIVGGIRTVDKGLSLSAQAVFALTAQLTEFNLTADKPLALSASLQQQRTAYL